MNIAVVGTGYVGLVTGAVFADLGNDVTCVDKDEAKIEGLRAGRMPIYEPGLEELVARNVADDRLAFTTDLGEAVRRSDIVFIAVGTPSKASGESDLSAVEEVALGIAEALDRYKVIVNKSTVPVGTGDLVREIIERNRRRPVNFDVVSNPEFLREGSAIEDTLRPDRIVVGAPNQQVAMTLLELYAPLERPMIINDAHSVGLIQKALDPLDDRVISVLGLAFKPKTDDMREAKSVEVVSRLLAAGAKVRAYDPAAMANAQRMLPPSVDYCQSSYEAAEGADAVVIVTEWNEFKLLNLERLRQVMRRPLVFDGRNIYEPERMRRLGFEYHSIGRKPVFPA